MATQIKTQASKQPPPPNKPRGTLVLDPGEETPIDPLLSTNPPSGKPPPPSKPNMTRIADAHPENDYQLCGGPEDGKWTNYKEANDYLKKGYGYIAPNKEIVLPRNKIASEQEPPYKASSNWRQIPFGEDRGKWITEQEYLNKYAPKTQRQTETAPVQSPLKTKLAQTTEPIPTPVNPKIIYTNQKDIDGWKKVADATHDTQSKKIASSFLQKSQNQGEKVLEEQYGSVPPQNLPIIARMYGEFKKFYYQGYAEYVAREKARGAQEAYYAQDAQVRAMRMGMSSLVNLHQGLDMASWNFFFKTLGPISVLMFGPAGALGIPLSAVLEKIHHGEINFNMDYHMGRKWWSPRSLEYAVSKIPEEKAVDLIFDAASNLIYYSQKFTGLNLFTKKWVYDRHGRPIKAVVFNPMLILQNKLNAASGFLDALTTEKEIINATKNINYLKEGLSFGDDHMQKQVENLIRQARANANRPFFINPIDFLSNDKKKRETARDRMLKRLARTVVGKNTARRLKNTQEDILSYFALLIGGWIYDVTIGNLINIVVEKITSSRIWAKVVDFKGAILEHPLTKTAQMGLRTVGDFAGAAPSINTVAGGYLGYNVGGLIGQNIAQALGINPAVGFEIGSRIGLPTGAGAGWGYQWLLNMGKDVQLMERANNYWGLQKNLKETNLLLEKLKYDKAATEFLNGKIKMINGDLGRSFFKINLNELELAKLPSWQQSILKTLTRFANKFIAPALNPGLVQKAAAWLQSPMGKFCRPPIKGAFVSQLLAPYEDAIRQYIPFYQGWMPPVIQYLWEIKGPFWSQIMKPSIGSFTTGAWNWMKFSKVTEAGMFDYQNIAVEYGNADYYMYRQGGQIKIGFRNLSSPTSWKSFTGTPRAWYRTIVEFNSTVKNTLNSFTQWMSKAHPNIYRYFKNFRVNKIGVTNFAGFLIGWELAATFFPTVPFAPIIGGVVGWFGLNPILNLISTIFPKFATVIPMFNAGYWLGTFANIALGVAGYNLPGLTINLAGTTYTIASTLWAPVASGLLFTLAPGFLMWAGSTGIASAFGIGTLLTTLGTSLMASAGTMAILITAGTIATVAAVTIFIVYIVGAAFWLPAAESLQGITNQSACFNLNTPSTVLNAKPGEQIESCNTLSLQPNTVFQENYINYDANLDIDKWMFQHGYYTVTKTVDGVSTDITNSITTIPAAIPSKWSTGGIISFKIPLDQKSSVTKEEFAQKTGLYDTINSIRSEVQKYSGTDGKIDFEQAKFINTVNLYTSQDIKNISDYLLVELKNHYNEPLASRQKIVANAKQKTDILLASALSDRNNIKIGYNCSTGSNAYLCQQLENAYQQRIAAINQEYAQFADFFITATIGNKDYFDNKTRLQENISNFAAAEASIKMQNDIIDKIKNNPITETDPQKFTDALKKQNSSIINDIVPNNLYAEKPNTSFKICIRATFNGSSGEASDIYYRSSAPIPIIPMLLSSFNCQVSTYLPVNANKNNAWPTDQKVCSRGFDTGVSHFGLDVCSPEGSAVNAFSDGVIIEKDYKPSFGCYIIMQNGDGLYSLYGHLKGDLFGNCDGYSGIDKGVSVKAGQQIANSGNTGNSTGPHLHFAISKSANSNDFYDNPSKTVDPCKYIVCAQNSGCNTGEAPQCGN